MQTIACKGFSSSAADTAALQHDIFNAFSMCFPRQRRVAITGISGVAQYRYPLQLCIKASRGMGPQSYGRGTELASVPALIHFPRAGRAVEKDEGIIRIALMPLQKIQAIRFQPVIRIGPDFAKASADGENRLRHARMHPVMKLGSGQQPTQKEVVAVHTILRCSHPREAFTAYRMRVYVPLRSFSQGGIIPGAVFVGEERFTGMQAKRGTAIRFLEFLRAG